MHIPDGYLSPSTCAALYAASAPFWYVSVQRMKRLAGTRMIPLISVFAAFSFVIMMFNLPLPGGTTGHAIGIGIAAIVLGPWGAIAAISIALAIQALFFGDGGLTTLGANCFNMGVVGSLTAYATYRIVAVNSGLRSSRRVVAAALAGYIGINAAALVAAIEFGLQPLWFHDAAGTPLYCPYPLSISIPAMTIGHLTFAGLAELTISAGVLRYLQSTDLSLLRATAPNIPLPPGTEPFVPETSGVPRRFWVALAVLLLLSPLGIVAAGSAWGEWSPQELGHAPQGLERLFTLWNAPIARYAPKFIPNAFAGYLMSALFGTGLVILTFVFLNWLFTRLPKRGFVEGTVERLVRALDRSLFAEQIALRDGLLQRLDARVKVSGILLLIAAAASVRRLEALALLFFLAIALATLSHVPIPLLAKRAWLPALAFSGLIAIPALFLETGPIAVVFLLGRVLTATTLSLLLILTTSWNRVLKALRFLHVPVTVVVTLGMTYRYLFVLLKTATEMFEARRVCLVGTLAEPDRQRLASASAGILLERSIALSQEIHLAMQARGFRGEVYLLDDTPLSLASCLQLALATTITFAVVLWP